MAHFVANRCHTPVIVRSRSDEPHVGLMNQSGGLKRLPGSLDREPGRRKSA